MIRVLRLEVACLIILTYIMVNYFSAKRRSTITHKIFASALIMSLIQIGFDIGLTIGIYQGKISQFFYRGYIATLVCFLAHIFAYFEEIICSRLFYNCLLKNAFLCNCRKSSNSTIYVYLKYYSFV